MSVHNLRCYPAAVEVCFYWRLLDAEKCVLNVNVRMSTFVFNRGFLDDEKD